MDDEKWRLEEELKRQNDALNLKLLDDANSEERKWELEDMIRMQKEETERLRKK